jgi:LacI family transcriptional regulator
MRKAVQKLAKKYNYQPDFRASSLRTGTGRTIGVLVPKVDRHFFSTILSGIDEVATQPGYNVLICQSFESLLKRRSNWLNSLMHGQG